MPFPIITGIRGSTSKDTLRDMRRKIVAAITEHLPGVPKHWTNPSFPADLLDEDPQTEDDGASTIYVRLDTAMFTGKSDTAETKKAVLQAICDIVWEAFEGKYEVEGFIGQLDKEGKVLIEPKKSR